MPVSRSHASTYDPYFEEKIQRAIAGLNSGRYRSVREAANQEGVKRTTLSDRYRGIHTNRKLAYEPRRFLNDSQEQTLLTWMDRNAMQGRPFDISLLRSLAFNLCGKSPGKKWCHRFIARHEELTKSKATGLDPTRGKNFNRPTIQDYFCKLAEIEEQYGTIPPNQKWNMDEKGIQLGGGRKQGNRKFIFSKKSKTRYKIRSDNLELVTVIECVSAAGGAAPCSFILTDGPRPDIRGIPNLADIGNVGVSETGWTDRGHAADWIVDVFLPAAKKHATDPSKPILLIIDGHDSHECLEIKAAVYRNSAGYIVIVLCFPSKCTHKLQPLDVAIFNHTQTLWKARCDELVDRGIRVTRYNVIHEYMKIRDRFTTKKLIEHAFAATGIHPLNPDIFTDEDYAPSQAFSIAAHAPESYPDPVPSSDLAIPSDAESENDDSDYKDSDSDSSDDSEGHTDSEDEGNVEITDVDFYQGYVWCTTTASDFVQDSPEGSKRASVVNAAGDSDSESDLSDWGSENGEWEDGTSLDAACRPMLRWWLRGSAAVNRQHTPLSHRENDSVPYMSVAAKLPEEMPVQTSFSRSPTPMSLAPTSNDPLFPPARSTRSVSRMHSELLSNPFPPLSREALEGLSHKDLITRVLDLQSRNHAITNALQRSEALRHCSDAHCTIALQQLTEAKTRLTNATQKAARGSTKIKARVVIGPDLVEHFEQEEKDAKEREREAREKEQAKSLETAARNKRIVEAASGRIFEGSWSSYRKEDLIGLARALQIDESGTISELKERIQRHLDAHADLANHQRFAALFNRRRTRRSQPDNGPHED